MYKIEFWFEHGGHCLWSANEVTRTKYGYAINCENLPLSKKTLANLLMLEHEYHTFLNWTNPSAPSPWTDKHKENFKLRANEIYNIIAEELGDKYEVVNRLDLCF